MPQRSRAGPPEDSQPATTYRKVIAPSACAMAPQEVLNRRVGPRRISDRPHVAEIRKAHRLHARKRARQRHQRLQHAECSQRRGFVEQSTAASITRGCGHRQPVQMQTLPRSRGCRRPHSATGSRRRPVRMALARRALGVATSSPNVSGRSMGQAEPGWPHEPQRRSWRDRCQRIRWLRTFLFDGESMAVRTSHRGASMPHPATARAPWHGQTPFIRQTPEP